VDFQDTTLIDYFKAVVFAGDILREKGKIKDDKLEEVLKEVAEEVKDNFRLDAHRARDAVDDAMATIRNKKKLSHRTGSISQDILYLASRMKDGRF